MDKNLNPIKFYGINDALNDLGQYRALVLNSEEGATVSVNSLNEFDYIKQYIYRLKADNEALNLIVNHLTAKEEKQEDKGNTWVSVTTRSGGDITIRVKDILFMNYDLVECEYNLHIRTPEEDKVYVLREESYEELKKLLVGNKETENV